MSVQILNDRWGSEEDQAVMYKHHGKTALIVSLSNSEKLGYEELAVGRVVTIDHQYSPDSADVYVNDDAGNCIGRVSRKNLVIQAVDRTKPTNDNRHGYLICLIKKARRLKVVVCLGSSSKDGKLVFNTVHGKKAVLEFLGATL